MKKIHVIAVGTLLLVASLCRAQTADAYGSGDAASGGLLDPTRFSINHSMSFGIASSSGSKMKSQSLYTTMLQYRFAAPVTLNLNFGFPIHSTFSQQANLNRENLNSMTYFENMPVDFSLSWKPVSNMLLQFSVVRETQEFPMLRGGSHPFSRSQFFSPD